MKCLLYSGGLDSACAWWVLGKPPALYCGGSFGPARHANLGEMAAIEKQAAICPEFAAALTVQQVDFRPFMRAGKYRFPRDKLLCHLAWALEFDGVMFNWTRDDGTTAEWAAKTAKLFESAIPGKFEVTFPVAHRFKRELVKAAIEAGCPPEFIEASHSCVRQSEGHCGKCENCAHRKQALRGLLRKVAA